MIEDLSPEQRIERGRRAAEMLSDDVFQSAIKSAREAVVQQFFAAPFNDTAARAAWATNLVLDAIEEDLRRTMSDGQLAAHPPNRKKPPPDGEYNASSLRPPI